MAEREGFEPPVPVKVRLISSQVHSTGLCHLSALKTLLINNFHLFFGLTFKAELLVAILGQLRFEAGCQSINGGCIGQRMPAAITHRHR